MLTNPVLLALNPPHGISAPNSDKSVSKTGAFNFFGSNIAVVTDEIEIWRDATLGSEKPSRSGFREREIGTATR